MNKTILITGATGGIGKAVATQFAKQGYDLVLHYNSDEKGAAALKETIEKEYGVSALTVKADLSEKEEVCIVSNCQAGYIELTMKALGIEKYITDIECPGYTNLPKGENCKLVMERNGFTSAVYVGDTQGDCDASAFAGIPFVFCEYGFGKPDRYDYKISKFSELLNLF